MVLTGTHTRSTYNKLKLKYTLPYSSVLFMQCQALKCGETLNVRDWEAYVAVDTFDGTSVKFQHYFAEEIHLNYFVSVLSCRE